jgi:hypothetical protein
MILGWLPADVSTFGPNIDSMLKLIIYVVGTAFVLAESALLAFVILYRRREGGRAFFRPSPSSAQIRARRKALHASRTCLGDPRRLLAADHE